MINIYIFVCYAADLEQTFPGTEQMGKSSTPQVGGTFVCTTDNICL